MERLSVDQNIEIIGSDSMMKEAIEQLPLNLQIKDLTDFLNLPELKGECLGRTILAERTT